MPNIPKQDGLYLGRPEINRISGRCCGKPVGCNMTHDGCVYLKHPWKRMHAALSDTGPRQYNPHKDIA